MIHSHEGDETTLYRFYDAADVLLYVGITHDPRQRFYDHRARPWWAATSNIRLERYPTRSEAIQAEDVAIRSEDPIFNRAGSLRPGPQTKGRAVVLLRSDLHAQLKRMAAEEGRTMTSIFEEIIRDRLAKDTKRKARVA